jgi:hypothetical protein
LETKCFASVIVGLTYKEAKLISARDNSSSVFYCEGNHCDGLANKPHLLVFPIKVGQRFQAECHRREHNHHHNINRDEVSLFLRREKECGVGGERIEREK